MDIVDNLLSIDPDKPLSANQGKVLKSLIDDNSSAIGQNASDLNAHKAESASKHIKESGSNANGSYIKFDDGSFVTFTWGNVMIMIILGLSRKFFKLNIIEIVTWLVMDGVLQLES